MDRPSLKIYVDTSNKSYRALVNDLIAETVKERGGEPSEELRRAWSAYYTTAISRGADVYDHPALVARLATGQDVLSAAAKIPDKQGPGWNHDVISFSQEQRKSFESAKQVRFLIWENLFPEGKDEIILPFARDDRSDSGKLQAYIDEHNIIAKKYYSAALDTQKGRPQVKQNIRSTENYEAALKIHGARDRISQRLIRRHPEDPAKIQTCMPKLAKGRAPAEEDWDSGRNFRNYLQKELQWELCEALQQDLDQRRQDRLHERKEQKLDRETALQTAAFKKVANHQLISADKFDPKSLCVVISRDPHLIAERSTGQREPSCTAEDGPEFESVFKDIEAGTLVAYVCILGDDKARYPLMRALIKPYLLDPFSEVDPFPTGINAAILVPALIYGGSGQGNARTREAFKKALRKFVERQNEGKFGLYGMAPGLYPDGQAGVVNITKDGASWEKSALEQQLIDFQEYARDEWLIELKQHSLMQEKGERGPHNQDSAKIVRKLINSIAQVYDAKNQEVGLGRKFFLEILRMSQGQLPDPKHIVDVLSESETLLLRHAAIEAFKNGNKAQWEKGSTQMPAATTRKLAVVAVLTTPTHIGKSLSETEAQYLKDLKAYFKRGTQSSLVGDNDGLDRGTFIRVRPDMVDCELAKEIAKEALTGSHSRQEHFNSLILTRPDLAKEVTDADLIKGLANVALYYGYESNVKEAQQALSGLLNLSPAFATQAMRHATSEVTNDDHHVRSNAYFTIGVIVEACPNQIDPVLIEIVKGGLTDSQYLVRRRAIGAISAIASRSKDNVDIGLIKDVFKVITSDAEEGNRAEAMKTLGACFEARPDLADLEMAKSIAEKVLRSDSIDTDIIPQKVIDVLIEKRPDVMKSLTKHYKEMSNAEGDRDVRSKAQRIYDATSERITAFTARDPEVKAPVRPSERNAFDCSPVHCL